MSAPVPCKICACIDGEPGLCHAVVPSGKACWRVQPDWCSACGTWSKTLRESFPTAPKEALACQHRYERAWEAAAKRGASVPGAYALRVHGVRMRNKALRLLAEAGLIDAAYKTRFPEISGEEKPKPLCPQSF